MNARVLCDSTDSKQLWGQLSVWSMVRLSAGELINARVNVTMEVA